tara:strand:- start:15 stop:125 length:111 start_codon:yes stop_codon:yes gene_type:complete
MLDVIKEIINEIRTIIALGGPVLITGNEGGSIYLKT